MLFAYITSAAKTTTVLQQLLGIFPRPTNFFNGKTNCCSYTMSFCDKDVNFKLIFPSFQWHAQNQLASVNFSFLKNTGNFGIATEKNLMSSTYITSKFDIEI